MSLWGIVFSESLLNIDTNSLSPWCPNPGSTVQHIPFYTNARPADCCPNYLVQLLELSKEENSITAHCNLHVEMLFAFAGVLQS